MSGPASEHVRGFYNRFHGLRSGDLDSHERARLTAIADALDRLVVPRVPSPRSILDLGCGGGWLADCLTAWGTVIGVDLADAALGRAARRYPHVRFVSGDLAVAPPLREGVFDVVVCSEVIEHVEDQPALVALVARLLCPGGMAIITCPNRLAAAQWWSQSSSRPQPLERWLTMEELRALLVPAFEVLGAGSVVGDYPGWGFPGRWHIRGDRWLRRALRALGIGRLRARLGRGLYVIVCARKMAGGAARSG